MSTFENCQSETDASVEKYQPKPVFCGCGGKAKVEGHFLGAKYEYWDVTCAECGISTEAHLTEAEAITAWNKAMSGSAEEKLKAFLDGMAAEMKAESAEPERKNGKWIATDWKVIYKCSNCGNFLNFNGVNAGRGDANFCPNCGADMRGDR